MNENQKIISAIKKLTAQETTVFKTQVELKKKSKTTAFILCFFLGCTGAHKFYMDKIGTGIVYLIGSCTVIGLPFVFIAVVFDLFSLNLLFQEYNKNIQKAVLKDIFQSRKQAA